MNRTIRQLTDSLTDLLPEDQQYYKLSDLRSWGFPGFIVNRIRVELERNLAESMRLPQTDWANMQSDTVQTIWKQFISAIRNEAWLPASYAATVIETAVGDVLEILVEPRKNIPDVVFGTENELTPEQLNKRVDVLVVYPHFASLLPRYMKKKSLETLTKDRCREIISRADQKITGRYTPLNWAQLLEPLFQLFDEQIDSSLLRLFFEDKKMARIARKFDFMDEEVDRAKLIETISSPESLNLMGYEDDQSDLFEAESTEAKLEAEAEDDQIQEQGTVVENRSAEVSFDDDLSEDEKQGSGEINTQNNGSEKKEHPEPDQFTEEPEDTGSPLNAIFSEETDAETEEEIPEDGTDFSLNDNFEESEEEDEDENEKEPPFQEETSAETEVVKEEDESDEPEVEEMQEASEEEEEVEENPETGIDFSEEVKKETPMWQRFMSEEELELDNEEDNDNEPGDIFSETGAEVAEESEDEEAGDKQDKPVFDLIFDLSENQEPDEEEVTSLRKVLQPERDYFVEEIFGGSDRAFDEALEDIASKKDWRNASRYLENEVFKRNMIDMYSEQAIEFTDRLHNYFLKKNESDS